MSRVLQHAAETGNVSATCRTFGISRKTFYEWQHVARCYGLEALVPKARRRPQLPNATPTHVIHELLALAVAEPTLGCRQLADRLADRGYVVSKTTVQKHLVEHKLGRRSQRIARAAAIAPLGRRPGHRTRDRGRPVRVLPLGSSARGPCRFDSFYIGHLKGVGKVYQLTAIDAATRLAIIQIVLGPVDRSTPAASSTTSDASSVVSAGRSGPSCPTTVPNTTRLRFHDHLGRQFDITHVRIPPRSPNHNAVCERFQGTALQECWRPAFHRRRFSTIGQLQAEADAWLLSYHHRRRNHGDYMRGRTPKQLLDNHRPTKQHDHQPQGPSVTSTLGPEELGGRVRPIDRRAAGARRRRRANPR